MSLVLNCPLDREVYGLKGFPEAIEAVFPKTVVNLFRRSGPFLIILRIRKLPLL